MKKWKAWKKIKLALQKRKIQIIGIIIILIASFSFFPIFASEGTDRIIRVGYPIQDGLTELDENGNYRGYTYEYLKEIAKYTGWKYEFVQVEGNEDTQLDTLLQMLIDGEIDIMGGMLYNENLTEIMDFPNYHYGTSYYTLSVLEDNENITSNNYYTLPSLKVAVYSTKKVKNQKLEQFAEMNGVVVEQVFCDTKEEMMSLLKNREVDAILAKDMNSENKKLKVVAQFSPQPFYFAATKGKKDIVVGLNTALESIKKLNPYFSAKLQEKYFKLEKQHLVFNDAEKAYLERNIVINTAVFAGKAPIQYIEKDTAKPKGISIDLLNYIGQHTGLDFQITIIDDFEEYQKLIQSGEADLAVGVTNVLFQYDWQEMMLTTSYIDVPVSVIVNNKINPTELSDKRLAVPKGIVYNGNNKGEIIYYDTIEKCLEAVHKGEADYCYANNYSAQYYLSDPRYKNMIGIAQSEQWEEEYCFGVVDKNNTELFSILNKTIQYIPETELLQTFLYANAFQPEEISLLSYISSNPEQAVLVILVIILMIVILILLNSIWKDKKNKRIRSLENARYEQISELSNEFLFEYDIEKDRLKLSEKTAVFLGMERIIEKISRTITESNSILPAILVQKDRKEELLCNIAGKNHWIRVFTKVIADANQKPIYIVGKMIDIQEEKEEKENLKERAQRDSLTKLYNAAACKRLIGECLQGEDREGGGALFILDVDYFKGVNDNYGHYIGDWVLEELAQIFTEIFRREDIIGRLGGDEFVIYMRSEVKKEIITQKWKTLQEKIGKIAFEGQKEAITVSVGIAVGKTGQGFEELYQLADQALYEVKKKGRNGFYINE